MPGGLNLVSINFISWELEISNITNYVDTRALTTGRVITSELLLQQRRYQPSDRNKNEISNLRARRISAITGTFNVLN